MSTKENKEFMTQYLNDLSKLDGDMVKTRSFADKFYAEGYIYVFPSIGEMKREQAIQFINSFFSIFPMTNISVNDMVAEDDQVVARYISRHIHKETYHGIAATGKQIEVEGVFISKIIDGKIVKDWELIDRLAILNKLGVHP